MSLPDQFKLRREKSRRALNDGSLQEKASSLVSTFGLR
jgi:hypothetical protein